MSQITIAPNTRAVTVTVTPLAAGRRITLTRIPAPTRNIEIMDSALRDLITRLNAGQAGQIMAHNGTTWVWSDVIPG